MSNIKRYRYGKGKYKEKNAFFKSVERNWGEDC